MLPRSAPSLILVLAFASSLVSACEAGIPDPLAPSPTSARATGITSLDAVISAALYDEPPAIIPFIQFTSRPCTTAQGLGGPPKCLAGESDGKPVEVLPFLGPGEGNFLRPADLPGWTAPAFARLHAVYEVAHAAPADPDYPAGDYALVFAVDDPVQMPVTLQVTHGRIVRIDYGATWPPEIPSAAVKRFLIAPPGDGY